MSLILCYNDDLKVHLGPLPPSQNRCRRRRASAILCYSWSRCPSCTWSIGTTLDSTTPSGKSTPDYCSTLSPVAWFPAPRTLRRRPLAAPTHWRCPFRRTIAPPTPKSSKPSRSSKPTPTTSAFLSRPSTRNSLRLRRSRRKSMKLAALTSRYERCVRLMWIPFATDQIRCSSPSVTPHQPPPSAISGRQHVQLGLAGRLARRFGGHGRRRSRRRRE